MQTKKILLFYITNEQFLNNVNHVNGLNGLGCFNFNLYHAVSEGIIIHVIKPVNREDIIYYINLFARRLENNGSIIGHGYIIPQPCSSMNGLSKNVLTTDNRYRQGLFTMEIW